MLGAERCATATIDNTQCAAPTIKGSCLNSIMVTLHVALPANYNEAWQGIVASCSSPMLRGLACADPAPDLQMLEQCTFPQESCSQVAGDLRCLPCL